MATKTKAKAEPVVPRDIPKGSTGAILSRVIRPEDGNLTAAAAEGFLALGFEDHDIARMHDLAVKNQDGQCTPGELEEMDNYIRVGYLLDMIHAKARLTLQTRPKRRKAR
jgi:hypothetical protein